MSFLYVAFHYPKAEHVNDLLAAMHRLDEVMNGTAGLQRIGAWREETGRCIIAISIWESREAFQAAVGKIGAAVADVPFDKWEARPRELFRAEEITLPL